MKAIKSLEKLVKDMELNGIEININDFSQKLHDYISDKANDWRKTNKIENKIAASLEIENLLTENLEACFNGLAAKYDEKLSCILTHDLYLVSFHF